MKLDIWYKAPIENGEEQRTEDLCLLTQYDEASCFNDAIKKIRERGYVTCGTTAIPWHQIISIKTT